MDETPSSLKNFFRRLGWLGGLVTKPVSATVVTALSLVLLWRLCAMSESRLGRPDYLSGYALLAVMLAMLLLSLRKKLLVLPLGKLAIWQQLHQYLGLFGIGSFLLHAGFVVDGTLECLLSALFWLISASGLLGWYLNVRTPKLLRTAGASVLREDIVQQRNDLAARAYSLALQAAGRIESSVLAEHYTSHLRPFFSRGRSLAYCLVPNGKQRRRLLHELDQLNRYLGPFGQQSQLDMRQLVQSKDDLDYQWAMQNRLRGWVIVHISLVWSFYFLVACHVYTVHQFHGN
jgi:hypothetical protein